MCVLSVNYNFLTLAENCTFIYVQKGFPKKFILKDHTTLIFLNRQYTRSHHNMITLLYVLYFILVLKNEDVSKDPISISL